MLNVVKEKIEKDGKEVLVARFAGSIDEKTDFDKLIGEFPKVLHVYCKQVPRINSDGIKKWVEYFQKLRQESVKVHFFECSTAIVEQMSLISNFVSGAKVESVYVPYVCENCNAELIGLFKTSTLKRINLKVPKLKCSKCGSDKTTFDDISDEYFHFLKR